MSSDFDYKSSQQVTNYMSGFGEEVQKYMEKVAKYLPPEPAVPDAEGGSGPGTGTERFQVCLPRTLRLVGRGPPEREPTVCASIHQPFWLRGDLPPTTVACTRPRHCALPWSLLAGGEDSEGAR